MMTRFCLILALVLAACGALVAQQGSLAGPVAGFVYDGPSRALRPIQGIPGAALIGDPVAFGLSLSAAYVSPRQDSAFVAGSDGSLHFFQLTSAGPVETSLGSFRMVPQGVVFSPSGSAAALYAEGRVHVFQGLPTAPALAAEFRLPAAGVVESSPAEGRRRPAPAAPSFALSDDGAYLLTVSGGSARLLSVNGDNRALAQAGPGSLVAFAPGGHDAALLDPAAGPVVIRDAVGAASSQTIAQPDDSLASAAGIGFSADGGKFYVASASAKAVVTFDLAAKSRSLVTCDCTPTTLAPMGALFRITELTPAPLWLLDGGAAAPRTVFVPARSN